MSSTNKTTNYNLSQFVGTDVPSYLGDYNSDMSKIDKAIGDVSNSQGSVEQSVTGLTAEVQGLSTQVSGVSTSVQQLQTSVTQIDTAYKQADSALSQRITANANNIQANTTAIESANTAIESNNTAIESINTSIGTANISEIGDGTIKGAISSINSSLTLDFSNASPDVQNVNTLLQNLLDKFYPNGLYIINGDKLTTGYSFKTSTDSNVALENGVYKYTRTGGGGANANTLPSIDFTSYNKIVMEFSDNSATVELGYADQSGIESAAAITNKVNTTNNSGKIEYDISQITGNHYIYFFMSDIVASSFVINKLYLE